ncbi:hypothetical protein sr16689 [Sporisorium reilianum SRZ2]|uniref:Uncharacterized protein n=1 Tax=Sporisorium reilianum (strain SRZ2) TaxID=999809 RepID=E6ZVM3_SPORE|nr:hypothetical protein sr16689 [Sporisorium reilianum SRZ2]
MRDKYPYGYIDRAKNDIFSRGLTLPNEENKKGYCSPEETIRRLGFTKKDEALVQRTLVTVYQAFVALELLGNGEGCVSRDFKHTSGDHMDLARKIALANPLIRLWYDPPEEYIYSLVDIVRKNSNTGIDQVSTQASSAEVSSAATARSRKDFMDASSSHRHLACLALKAVLGQFWSKSNSTWLSSTRQRYATEESQWDELRQQSSDQDFKQDGDVIGYEGCWLPTYSEARKMSLDDIVGLAETRVLDIYSRRREIQERQEEENARLQRLAETITRPMTKRAKRLVQRNEAAKRRRQRLRESLSAQTGGDDDGSLSNDNGIDDDGQSVSDAQQAGAAEL